jgi:hypothetical protein
LRSKLPNLAGVTYLQHLQRDLDACHCTSSTTRLLSPRTTALTWTTAVFTLVNTVYSVFHMYNCLLTLLNASLPRSIFPPSVQASTFVLYHSQSIGTDSLDLLYCHRPSQRSTHAHHKDKRYVAHTALMTWLVSMLNQSLIIP